MRKILSCFSYPFTVDFSLFLMLWIMISLVDFAAYMIYGLVFYAFYFALHGYLMAYLITWLGSFFKYTYKIIYYLVFLGLGIINVLVDVMCQYNFRIKFTTDMAEIIKATNVNETFEFMHTFLKPFPLFIWCLICMLVLIVFVKKGSLNSFAGRYAKIMCLVGFGLLLVIVAISTIKKSNNWGGIFINKLRWLVTEQVGVDLSDYRHFLHVYPTTRVIPKNIVIIIGESHSKYHSSLYGYRKKTQPLLEQRSRQGNLVIYDKVEAPALHTLDVFRQILNSGHSHASSDKQWYEYETVFDVADALDMETYWISNQDKKGMYDNISTSYALLCDSIYFAGKNFMVAGRIQQDGNYDENVISICGNIPFKANKRKKFFVFHLMGSHEAFQYRYPKDFKHFHPNDYLDKTASQQEVLAHYDNSILYNDYVTDKIIQLFEDEETIIFYFSDHSIDIFNSSDSYFGHARVNDSASVKAAKAIPFWVYVSPSLQKKAPEIMETVRSESIKPFCTNTFYQKLISILGIQVK